MSSLIWRTDEAEIFVATDTLATLADGAPLLLTSKAVHLPHLRLIVAGTGWGRFHNTFAMYAACGVAASGIEGLDRQAPEVLRGLRRDFEAGGLCPGGQQTTTVHVLGFSEHTDKVVSFRYRSTEDFASEGMEYGTLVKPDCTLPADDLFDHIPAMMLEQRQREAQKPPGERVYIGGEIWALHLTRERCVSFCMGKFEDYDQQRIRLFGRR
jgi:hypothetical protein